MTDERDFSYLDRDDDTSYLDGRTGAERLADALLEEAEEEARLDVGPRDEVYDAPPHRAVYAITMRGIGVCRVCYKPARSYDGRFAVHASV